MYLTKQHHLSLHCQTVNIIYLLNCGMDICNCTMTYLSKGALSHYPWASADLEWLNILECFTIICLLLLIVYIKKKLGFNQNRNVLRDIEIAI